MEVSVSLGGSMLTRTFGSRPVRSIALAFGLVSACLQAPLNAQWINQPTAGIPRTADGKPNLTAPVPKAPGGKPDLSGLWTLRQNGGGISQLKPEEIKPWAQTLFKQREEDLGRDDPSLQCLPSGFTGGLTKIVQTRDLIVLLSEDLTYRQIFLDGRELPKNANPAWMGYSVGHWDGDTLVVESTGYNDRTWLDDDGHPHSEDLRITERFRRPDFGHLEIEKTLEDPKALAQKWVIPIKLEFDADTELLEYVCAENERDHSHLVGKASDDKQKEVQVAPEILKSYVGIYEFKPPEHPEDPIPIDVSLEGSQLKVALSGG